MSRDFFLLWQGQLVSQAGTQMFMIALLLWLKHATGSATLVGLLMMVATLPGVILGPLGGALADRHSRRAVLVVSDLVRGTTLVSLAAALFFFPDSHTTAVAWLFVAAVIGSCVAAVFQPAGLSLIPDLVPKERVASANSLTQASFQLCALLSQAVGGVLFRVLGAPLLALVDGATYFYSAVSEAFIRVPPRAAPVASTAPAGRRMLAEIRQALAYIQEREGMRMLFYTAALLRFFMVPFSLLFPFYVEGHLKATPDWYGFLVAAAGLGGLVGFIVAGTFKTGRAAGARVIPICLLLASIGLGALGLVSRPWMALVLVLGVGLLNGLVNIKLITLLQVSTPTEVRGRVFGVLRTITEGLAPLAMAITGVVADLTGQNVGLIYVVCGGATASLSLLMATSGECRRFLATDMAPAPVSAQPAVQRGVA